jgi:hypothetical protein
MVLGSVNLDRLPEAVTAVPVLVDGLLALLAALPDAGFQGRPETGVVLPDQLDDPGLDRIGTGPIAAFTAFLRDQSLRTVIVGSRRRRTV